MTAEQTYTNPVLANVADPDVLFYHGQYYLYGTTTTGDIGGIKVYQSPDLVHWQDHGLAMTAGPDNWGTAGFWAPAVGVIAHQVVMIYTANEHLCVTVADTPLGPFRQRQFGPLHEATKEIDANLFADDDGQWYLYFVRFNDDNEVWGARFDAARLTIDETTLTPLLIPSQPWEQDLGRINEAPYMLKHHGQYYLTYSGSHFASPNYGVGYATGTHPLGSFQKYAQNPVLQANAAVHGVGHHALTRSPDGSEGWIVYHRHYDLTNAEPRQVAIDRFTFTADANGGERLTVAGPTSAPRPLPAGSSRL